MSKQKRKVEWSFDFEDIGDRVNQFFSDTFGGDLEVETADLEVLRDDATSSTVRIDFSVGRANVTALAPDDDKLFAAHITYVGEYDFDVAGSTDKQITLKQKSNFPRGFGKVMSNAKDLVWDINLAQNIPHTLRLKGGVGETDIDLTNLTITSVKMDTGVGKMVLTLPIQDAIIDASVNGGVGETQVIVPAGVTGNLDIKGGVGEVVVTVAPDANVRVNASAGLGDIKLPKRFTRTSGNGQVFGMQGVWETENFADADNQIVIDYEGGVGSFRLKTFEVI